MLDGRSVSPTVRTRLAWNSAPGVRSQHAMRADGSVEDAEREEDAEDREAADRAAETRPSALTGPPEPETAEPVRHVRAGDGEQDVVAVVAVDRGDDDGTCASIARPKARSARKLVDAGARARRESGDEDDAQEQDDEVERVGGGERHHHHDHHPRDPCSRVHRSSYARLAAPSGDVPAARQPAINARPTAITAELRRIGPAAAHAVACRRWLRRRRVVGVAWRAGRGRGGAWASGSRDDRRVRVIGRLGCVAERSAGQRRNDLVGGDKPGRSP